MFESVTAVKALSNSSNPAIVLGVYPETSIRRYSTPFAHTFLDEWGAEGEGRGEGGGGGNKLKEQVLITEKKKEEEEENTKIVRQNVNS